MTSTNPDQHEQQNPTFENTGDILSISDLLDNPNDNGPPAKHASRVASMVFLSKSPNHKILRGGGGMGAEARSRKNSSVLGIHDSFFVPQPSFPNGR